MKTFVDFTLCGLNHTNIVVPYLGWHAGMPGPGRAAAASRPPEQFLTVCSSLAANYPSPAPTHTRKLSSAAPDMWGLGTQHSTIYIHWCCTVFLSRVVDTITAIVPTLCGQIKMMSIVVDHTSHLMYGRCVSVSVLQTIFSCYLLQSTIIMLSPHWNYFWIISSTTFMLHCWGNWINR